MLQTNEFSREFDETNSIKYYDFNQLASNNPIEDTRMEAQCLFTKGNSIPIAIFYFHHENYFML